MGDHAAKAYYDSPTDGQGLRVAFEKVFSYNFSKYYKN